MFERFTDRARRVLVLAHEESRLHRHGDVGVEHLLIGLVHEGDGMAARVLESLGITVPRIQEAVLSVRGQGETDSGSPPFTAGAKRVLEQSQREALALGHQYIGPEHILLGVAHDDHGVAIEALAHLGVEHDFLREAMLDRLARRDPIPAVDPADVTPAESTPHAFELLAPEDVEAVWRDLELDGNRTVGERDLHGLLYRWTSFEPLPRPTAWLAVAAAEVNVDAFDRFTASLQGPDAAIPVEGIGDRATFNAYASALRVLSGSTLFVVTVTNTKGSSLELASELARRVIARLQS